ncbi:MAG TPA: PEGA domain-containing protein [Thioploca sp.]|nr:MAG: hypothetical protein DRR19_06150 [Gammaproteobacteria bacterium]HDN27269.1 PEGA domain-containing protein [Thioploca sp.]
MKKLFWIAIMGLVIVGTGCGATRQVIDITSEPSKAAVSVNDEFIGKTPIIHKVEDVDEHDSLVIQVEKLGYESDMKRIEKKGTSIFSSGKFPKKLHFVLQPTRSLHETKERLEGE